MVKADWKRWNFRWRLKLDRVSIERICASRRCRHRKGPRGKVASNTGWSGKEICIGRTQRSGWKIGLARDEFRTVAHRPKTDALISHAHGVQGQLTMAGANVAYFREIYKSLQ